MSDPNIDILNATQDIAPFDVTDSDQAFPAGNYLFALGGINAVYPKDNPEAKDPDAVNSDVWALKYLGGSDNNAKPSVRITIKDGKVIMDSIRGVKIVERYPHPRLFPKMQFKASGFFSKFDGCIEEVEVGGFDASGDVKKKKIINWKKVQAKYGTVFQATLHYTKVRPKPGKKADDRSFRNFDYTTITPTAAVIPADDMRKIEEMYDSLKKQSEAQTTEAPPSASDLPF